MQTARLERGRCRSRSVTVCHQARNPPKHTAGLPGAGGGLLLPLLAVGAPPAVLLLLPGWWRGRAAGSVTAVWLLSVPGPEPLLPHGKHTQGSR